MNTWLWPDRTIGKRESAELRKQHNALVNTCAELLEALEALLEGRPTEEPPNEMSVAHRNWILFEKGRAAIQLAKGK